MSDKDYQIARLRGKLRERDAEIEWRRAKKAELVVACKAVHMEAEMLAPFLTGRHQLKILDLAKLLKVAIAKAEEAKS